MHGLLPHFGNSHHSHSALEENLRKLVLAENRIAFSDMMAGSFVEVRILVVDDDSICLSVIAAYLRALNHEVAMAKHPFDALSILRGRRQVFDLVLSDYHMPNMTGLELQKIVREEFDLPVIIMSADDSEVVILHCLNSGASFYIVKPVDPNDLKTVWQYVVSKKNESSSNTVAILEIDNVGETPLKDRATPNEKHEKALSAVSTVVAKKGKKKKKKATNMTNKTKTKRKEEGGSKVSVTASKNKLKVVWTDDLHHRFLQAIDCLGWENAIPTRINDLMNIPGLTRENIASHLQKYRIFLRKVSQSGVEKLRDPKVASRLGIAPTVLSTMVEQRFPPKHLHSSQQLFDSLVKLRGNTQDQPNETLKQRLTATANSMSELGDNRPLSPMTGETTTGVVLDNNRLPLKAIGNSDQRGHLASPAVTGGSRSRNEGGLNEKPLGSASGSFVILDSSNEMLPDIVNGNSRQIYRRTPLLLGDNGEDPLLKVIKDFDHLGANSFVNIPQNGGLTNVVGDTSQNFNQQRPVDQLANLEAPVSKNPIVNDEPADQDWMDFMDSLWRSNEDLSWD